MTDEPGGDVREAIARLIDPSSWRVFDGYLADVKRKYKGVNAAYDPEAFKDRKSLAKADAILALISKRQRGYEAQPASVPAEGEADVSALVEKLRKHTAEVRAMVKTDPHFAGAYARNFVFMPLVEWAEIAASALASRSSVQGVKGEGA